MNRFFLFFLFICASSICTSLRSQACESMIKFAFADEKKVVIYNMSTGYDQVQWDLGDGEVHHFSNDAVVVDYAEFPVTVCLTITNEAGCSDQSCVEIYPGSPDDICQTTDCIWPGDMDGDGKANNYDLLRLGFGIEELGTPRTHFPIADDSIAWLPSFGEDWSLEFMGTNFKHFDANGNGVIEEKDKEAILYNYDPDFDFQTIQDSDGPKVYLEFQDSSIQIGPGANEKVHVDLQIRLGTFDFPVTNIQGIAFSIDYPNSIVEPGSARAFYPDTSFFGRSEEVITIQKDLFSSSLGRLDLGLSRRSGREITGFGTIFTTSFVVISDIAIGKGVNSIPFEVSISKVALVNNQGQLVPVQLESVPASIDLQIGTITSTRPNPTLNNKLQLFPNPTSSLTRLQWTDLQPEWIQVTDALGKVVLRQQANSDYLDLDTRGWGSGLYLVQIGTSDGTATKRLMVR